jgi:curved DNA-binding protein CbpA
MLAVTDPYKVLQVDPDAELEVIRAAYRALALKYHPDVSTGSQDRMAALNHAWGILRDAGARAAFDQARADAKRKREVRQPEVRQPEVSYEMRAPMPATPPGKPFGSVLDFGRYAGWSLGQVASCDPEYLEWLARTPVGRSFHREINGLLATHAAAAAATATATAERRPGRFRRN